MAITSDQILQEIVNGVANNELNLDVTGDGTTDVSDLLQLSNNGFFQALKPRLDSLIRSSMLVDSGVVRAFSRFNYVDDVVQNVIQNAGHSGQRIGVPYGTDAQAFSLHQIPTVVLGPGSIDQAHTKDEWIELEQLTAAADLYYQLISEFGVQTFNAHKKKAAL